MKTFKVQEFKAYINSQLEREDSYMTEDVRGGLILALEEVLHNTANYNGFTNYGWANGGCERWEKDGRPEDKTPYYSQENKRIYF